jgi:secreted trypsin-like serine protease
MLKRTAAAAALSLTMSIFLSATAPAVAQEGEHNWMREYVELRKQAMLERAIGVEAAAALRARMSARIVGGTDAKPGSNPFQVALLQKAIANDRNAQFCGGTLVKKNYVVTAAHCSAFAADSVQVLVGSQRLDGSGTRLNVQTITNHPDWNPITYDFDVAVWKLASDANGIPLARLANGDPPLGTRLLATGWGDTESIPSFPVLLREVKVPLVSRRNCNDANSYSGDITGRMICAGLNAGGKDTCQGDSGGPLTRRQNGNYKVLTGITSWGIGCAEPNFFGVYTRVSHPSIRNFIVNEIN